MDPRAQQNIERFVQQSKEADARDLRESMRGAAGLQDEALARKTHAVRGSKGMVAGPTDGKSESKKKR